MPKRREHHGMSRTPIYRRWTLMWDRCTNENTPCYATYGGRGITVADEWRSFVRFLSDVGEPPTERHQLDRIDNERGYEPGNVRWATSKENNRNRRDSRLLTVNGVTRHMCEWAEDAGVSPKTISNRLCHGWSHEDAVTRPIETKKRNGRATFARQEMRP